MSEKRCPKCNRVLPLAAFASGKNRPDGLQGHCRECQSAFRAAIKVFGRAGGTHDAEASTMAAVVAGMNGLDDAARRRVLAYMVARYTPPEPQP